MGNNDLFVEIPSTSFLPPIVDRTRFAELVGIPVGVVEGWIAKGYLPTFQIGKYSLVNLVVLQKRALEKELTR